MTAVEVFPASAQVGNDGFQIVSASYGAPAAAVQRILDAGMVPKLERTRPGVPYVFEQQVIVPTNGKVFGPDDGYAEIVPASSYTELVGIADTDKGVFQVASTFAASSGTLQRAERNGSRTIRLNFNPAPGCYRIRSTTSGTQYVTYNANVIGYEIVYIVSTASVGGGNFDCLLSEPLWQNHGSGSTVHAATSARAGVEFSRLFLNFAGKTHPAGWVLDGVTSAWLRDCKASGFSRAQLSALNGSRAVVNDRFVCALSTNCSVRIQSSDVEVTELRCERSNPLTGAVYLREHANGITRALITARHASRGFIRDCVFEGGSVAVSWWGGKCAIDGGLARDNDPSYRIARDTELVSIAGFGLISAHALDFGNFASPSNWGEFGLGHTVKDFRIEGGGGRDGGGGFVWPAAYICDVYGCDFDLAIINTGPSYADAGTGYATGIMLYDCFDARIRLKTKGVDSPIRIEGNSNYVRIEDVDIDPFDGLSSVPVSLARIGGAGALGEVSFGTVKLATLDSLMFYTGFSSPTAASLMCISIDRLIVQNYGAQWTTCAFFRQTESTSAAIGEEMEEFATTVSGTAVRGVRNPSTASEQDKLTAICAITGAAVGPSAQDTWMLGAKGSERAIKSSSTLNYSDFLKAGAGAGGRDIVTGDAANSAKGVVKRLAFGGLVQTHRR